MAQKRLATVKITLSFLYFSESGSSSMFLFALSLDDCRFYLCGVTFMCAIFLNLCSTQVSGWTGRQLIFLVKISSSNFVYTNVSYYVIVRAIHPNFSKTTKRTNTKLSSFGDHPMMSAMPYVMMTLSLTISFVKPLSLDKGMR